uniref:AMP-binding protein n=1 Tax=Erwinia amylovora TaxID=552 RepID=UPI0037DDB8B0
MLNQTPSAFRAFARAEADSGLSHQLRWVIFGGEALETASLGEWYQRHAEDAPQLVNMYGITARWIACSTPPRPPSASASATPGACSTPSRSTSPSGRSGARGATADGW